jgi:type II secretory pathway pseudopilin PulG
MTLVEVMVAMGVFTIATLGILGTFLQSRHNTNFQKKQIQVETLIQGVLEQLKNRTAAELLATPVPTVTAIPAGQNCLTSMSNMNTFISNGGTPPFVTVQLDTNPAVDTNLDKLVLSPEPYISPNNINPGAIPVDTDGNGFGDINGNGADDVGVNTVFIDTNGTNGLDGSTNITTDDLRINIMIWIKDYSAVSGPVTVPSKAILINYTWTYNDGKVTREMIGNARAIKTPL